jgi:hypothetical protein
MSIDGNQREVTWFELDPFVSEVVIWIDADIVEKHSEFKDAHLAERLISLCWKLSALDIAVVERSPEIVYLPNAALRTECGRSDIFPRWRYHCSAGESDPQGLRRYEKAADKVLQRRLGFIVRKTITVFQCLNARMIDGSRSRDELIDWKLFEEGKVLTNANRAF